MDPIAQYFNTIKNGYQGKLQEVVIPYSNFKNEITLFLQRQGLIQKFEILKNKKKKKIKIILKYENGAPSLSAITQYSKQGRKFYVSSKDLIKYLRTSGIALISTPSGLKNAREAKKEKIGGELICIIK